VTANVTITGGAVSDVVTPASGQNPQAATLSFPGGTAEFPIRTAVDGNSSIDLSTLTRHTGLTALDYR
jgi:citrate synthase